MSVLVLNLETQQGERGGGRMRAWPETLNRCKQESPLHRLTQSHLDRAESCSKKGSWGPVPGLAARLREEGWHAQRSGPGNHITRQHVAAMSSVLWLMGLGEHPSSASLGRDLGLWWAFRLDENVLEPGKGTLFYTHWLRISKRWTWESVFLTGPTPEDFYGQARLANPDLDQWFAEFLLAAKFFCKGNVCRSQGCPQVKQGGAHNPTHSGSF